TVGHGPVFPVTHGGGLMLRPTAWKAFAKGWLDSMKVSTLDRRIYRDSQGNTVADPETGKPIRMGRKNYLDIREAIMTDPKYSDAVAAGVKVRPDEGPQGVLARWMTRSPSWSRMAWIGLQKMRFELWKQYMGKFDRNLASDIQKVNGDMTMTPA